jgi:pimeloyl-ACP methyl ester carboxylesterase
VRKVPNFAAGLARIYDECAADPNCAAAFPDPERDLLEAYRAIVEDPWTVEVDTGVVASGRFTINEIDFLEIIANMLYADFTIRYLPAVLHGFAERDGRVAVSAIEQTFGGAAYDGLAIKYTAWCRDADWASAVGPAKRAAEPYPQALRDVDFIYMEDCEEWPVLPAPAERRRPVRADLPVLILSGAYDSVVPASGGMDQLAGLPKGRQVIFPFSAHTIPSSVETAACAFRIMNDFLDDPGRALDSSCVRELPPITYPSSLPREGND